MMGRSGSDGERLFYAFSLEENLLVTAHDAVDILKYMSRLVRIFSGDLEKDYFNNAARLCRKLWHPLKRSMVATLDRKKRG